MTRKSNPTPPAPLMGVVQPAQGGGNLPLPRKGVDVTARQPGKSWAPAILVEKARAAGCKVTEPEPGVWLIDTREVRGLESAPVPAPPPVRTYVVARDFVRFAAWCREKGISPMASKKAEYVRDADFLRGVAGPLKGGATALLVLEGAERRRDYGDIMRQAMAAGFGAV